MRAHHLLPLAFVLTLSTLGLGTGCDAPPPPGNDAGPDDDVDAGPTPAPTTVAINEVMAKNDTTIADSAGEFDDWLELFNLTDTDVALDGFTLADSGSAAAAFPAGAVVPANGFLVLFADDATDSGTAEEPHFPFKLGGAGDTLTLRDAAGDVVDTVSFPALDDDVSFGRIPDGSDTLEVLPTATPGAANDGDGGEGEGEGEGECTPPFATAPAIFVNEVLAQNTSSFEDPDEPGAFEPYIELYNGGDVDVLLTGLALADNAAMLDAWPLPAQSLAPGEFLVVLGDGEPDQGAQHASFLLTDLDPVVVLGDTCGSVFHTLDLVDDGADSSVGLVPDGDVAGAGARTPTPGASND